MPDLTHGPLPNLSPKVIPVHIDLKEGGMTLPPLFVSIPAFAQSLTATSRRQFGLRALLQMHSSREWPQ